MNRRDFMAGTAAIAVVLGLPMAVFAQDAETDAGPIEVSDIVYGDADAPIEIVEYASYTCPHCASFHEHVFKPLKFDYIDTGKVRFIFREVYFDKFGLWAAMVARCGGDMRVGGLQDMLFEKQSEWIAGGKDPMAIVENLRTIGKSAGLTDENLDACLNDGDMARAMVDKFTLETERDDVSSTPTLFINGEKNRNMAYEDLKEKLDALLEG